MEVCFTILAKLFAMSLIVILGYVAKKLLHVDRSSIAQILLYILAPILFFLSIAKMEFKFDNLLLPFVMLAISSSAGFIIYKSKILYNDNKIRSFLAFSASNSNVGYFLLPVIWALFDHETVATYILIIVGNIIYENTVGFYFAARGHYDTKESLKKLISLPTIYAYLVGLFFSFFNIEIPCMFSDLETQVKGAYSLFGMMIIGIALAEVIWKNIDYRFIAVSFLGKYLLLPAITFIFIALDHNILNIYSTKIHKLLILASSAPLAANNIVIGSITKACPTKAASAVLMTTIFSTFLVPLVILILDL